MGTSDRIPSTTVPQERGLSLDRLEAALRKADAAGDVDAAKTLATAIQRRQHPVTEREKFVGFPLTRLALGVSAPVLGLAQLGLHAIGRGEKVDKPLAELERAKQRGMTYWAERTGLPIGPGVDWIGMVGSALPFLPFGGAATALGRAAAGARTGAVMGAASPVEDTEDFARTKAMQIGLGTVAGGLIPAAMEGAKKLGAEIGKIGRVATTTGPGKLLTEYQRRILGESNIPAVVTALQASKPLVPDSLPTAAEAVSHLPAGSPLQAHQQIVAQLPGGPSAAFGERLTARELARQAAWKDTEQLTTPLREEALAGANAQGGIPTPSLLANIFDLSEQPGLKGSSLAKRTLDHLRTSIADLAGPTLKVDARDLYTIRKELGTYIATASKETANWDKKVTAMLLRDLQHRIDDAIEEAGGVGWKKYLATFSTRAKAIEQDLLKQKQMYRPIQRTVLSSTPREEDLLSTLPHILSRPMVISNYLLGKLSGDVQPKIQAEAFRRYLNPRELATALAAKPPGMKPQQWEHLVRASGLAGSTLATRLPEMAQRPSQ